MASIRLGDVLAKAKAITDDQLKATLMVELMIEKGVFTREEYLAKVRR